MATPITPPAVWDDQFETPPREEVRAAAQAVLDSGDLDRPLTTPGFSIDDELSALIDRLVEEGPVRGEPFV